MKDDRLAEYRC